MCGSPEYSSASSVCRATKDAMADHAIDLASRKQLVDKTGVRESRTSLLELAANNDLDGFRQAVEVEGAEVDELGSWYGRRNGTNQIVNEQRTPAMIAALYGSVDVLSYILSFFDARGADINRKCGVDGSTALHCAASGGTPRAVETVALLLRCGADRDAVDNHGLKAADVVFTLPKLPHVKAHLDRLLKPDLLSSAAIEVPSPNLTSRPASSVGPNAYPVPTAAAVSFALSPHAPSGCELRMKPSYGNLPNGSSSSDSHVSGVLPGNDASLPDVKSSIYSTDEFRMYSFKVKACSRAYSHDWTECPFVHPGENARRRDPRRYHYSCVPCPDFRKGSCRRGDGCEYAHGVFECWLHPAQYRTRLCKEGPNCTRRVCFFAHKSEELRPLYTTSGTAALHSSRCTSPINMRSLSPPMPPRSPQSVLFASQYSPATSPSGITPPLSPSTSGSLSLWNRSVQSSVPTLHLPSGLHAARVRALQARVHGQSKVREDGQIAVSAELEAERIAEFAASFSISLPSRVATAVSAESITNLSARVARSLSGPLPNLGLPIPSDMEELFSSAADAGALSSSGGATLHSVGQSRQSQLIQQQQWRLLGRTRPLTSPICCSASSSMSTSECEQPVLSLSPIFVALNGKHAINGHELESKWIAGDGVSTLASSLGQSLTATSVDLSDWGSPTGKLDWGVSHDQYARFRKSASFSPSVSSRPPALEEQMPDLTWVQKLVRETAGEAPAAMERLPRENSMERLMLGHWVDPLVPERVA